jgi:hypothetical protein
MVNCSRMSSKIELKGTMRSISIDEQILQVKQRRIVVENCTLESNARRNSLNRQGYNNAIGAQKALLITKQCLSDRRCIIFPISNETEKNSTVLMTVNAKEDSKSRNESAGILAAKNIQIMAWITGQKMFIDALAKGTELRAQYLRCC